MTRRHAAVWILVAAVLGAVVGVFGTYRILGSDFEKELLSIALMHEAYQAGFAANILRLEEEERRDTLVKLAVMELENSLYQTGRMTRDGARLEGIALPNTIDSVRRAREYAVEHSLGSVREADWFLEANQPR